jgi:hypothetical protein
MSGMSNMRPAGSMSCVALMTTQMWPIWPSGDPRFDMPALDHVGEKSYNWPFCHINVYFLHVHVPLTSIILGIFEPVFQDLEMHVNWWSNQITIIYPWAKVLSGWHAHFSTIHQIIKIYILWWCETSYLVYATAKHGVTSFHLTHALSTKCYVESWRFSNNLSNILLWGWQQPVHILPNFKSMQVSVNSSNKSWLPLWLTTNVGVPYLAIILVTKNVTHAAAIWSSTGINTAYYVNWSMKDIRYRLR